MKPSVDTVQTTWEFDRLLGVLPEFAERILEVGIWEGGTLWHWLQMASVVVAVDDTMRDPGPAAWLAWAEQSSTDLRLLHGASSDSAIVDQAREHGPYDLIFIDADHAYDGVAADWRNYRGMVNRGGIVCFHDIVLRDGYGVAQLWDEIKREPDSRTVEIVENSGRFNGIGMVWL